METEASLPNSSIGLLIVLGEAAAPILDTAEADVRVEVRVHECSTISSLVRRFFSPSAAKISKPEFETGSSHQIPKIAVVVGWPALP